MKKENKGYESAKSQGIKHIPTILSNGDTKKQLLARSRHLLYKSQDKWTVSQQERAQLLFDLYPEIKKAYKLTNGLRAVYNQRAPNSIAMTKLAQWCNQVENSYLKQFNTVLKTFAQHYSDILNYFNNRSTNASAESFNAKLKYFRMMYRGVRDRIFFLFRLSKLFA